MALGATDMVTVGVEEGEVVIKATQLVTLSNMMQLGVNDSN